MPRVAQVGMYGETWLKKSLKMPKG
jgi:hypothetical protein